jgi:hypothetical protein
LRATLNAQRHGCSNFNAEVFFLDDSSGGGLMTFTASSSKNTRSELRQADEFKSSDDTVHNMIGTLAFDMPPEPTNQMTIMQVHGRENRPHFSASTGTKTRVTARWIICSLLSRTTLMKMKKITLRLLLVRLLTRCQARSASLEQ